MADRPNGTLPSNKRSLRFARSIPSRSRSEWRTRRACKLRFERSKHLFTRPDHPTLATIAAECGYADQAHMARDWRELAGCSPTEWLATEVLPFLQDAADAPDGYSMHE